MYYGRLEPYSLPPNNLFFNHQWPVMTCFLGVTFCFVLPLSSYFICSHEKLTYAWLAALIWKEAWRNKGGKASHSKWRNYDDLNEYFWWDSLLCLFTLVNCMFWTCIYVGPIAVLSWGGRWTRKQTFLFNQLTLAQLMRYFILAFFGPTRGCFTLWYTYTTS